MAFVHKEPSAAERALRANPGVDTVHCVACGRAGNVAHLEMRRLSNGEVHPVCINPVECRVQGGWPPLSS